MHTVRSYSKRLILTVGQLFRPDSILAPARTSGEWVTFCSLPLATGEHLVHSDADRAMQIIWYGMPGGPLVVAAILQVGDVQLRSIAGGPEVAIQNWLTWLSAARCAHWFLNGDAVGHHLWLSHEQERNELISEVPGMAASHAAGQGRACDIEDVGRVAVELGRPESKLVRSLLPGQEVKTLVVSAAGSLLHSELRDGSAVVLDY